MGTGAASRCLCSREATAVAPPAPAFAGLFPSNPGKRRARAYCAVERQRSRAGRGQRLPSHARNARRCLSSTANLGSFGSTRAEAIPPKADAVNRMTRVFFEKTAEGLLDLRLGTSHSAVPLRGRRTEGLLATYRLGHRMNSTATYWLTCLALLGCQSQEPAPALSAAVAASGELVADVAVSPVASASALLSASSDANLDPQAAREAALKDALEFHAAGAPNAPVWDDPNSSTSRRLGPESPPPSVRMGTTTVSGRLPPEVVKRIVRQQFGRFRLCYENALRANPTLAGTVTTTFTIRTDGSTEGVSTNSDLADKEVAPCVAKVLV